jgi:hypothetical protein
MKLKFLGAFPYRTGNMVVEEWGNRLLKVGEITDELSSFEAKYIMEKYKNVFVEHVEQVEEKQQEEYENKMYSKKGKNK